jgi:phosphoglycolate phosphatase-like HAD superfamily hydrolase
VERAVAVGDAVWDAKAAAEKGVEFVGVRTGGTRPDELRAEGATAVYDDAAALAADLRSSPLARLLTGPA